MLSARATRSSPRRTPGATAQIVVIPRERWALRPESTLAHTTHTSVSIAPNVRRQLTLFVAGPWASRLEALRHALDPVQASLIGAHVTVCREDEIEGASPSALFNRVEAWVAGPIRMGFGQPERFDGHGVLLPCVHGSREFNRLRQWVLQERYAREHRAHITLAHPRNPRSAGNTDAALAAWADVLELQFEVVALIEQLGSGPWRVLQEATLGSTAHGVA